jgi:hypothetical protein
MEEMEPLKHQVVVVVLAQLEVTLLALLEEVLVMVYKLP